MLNLLVKTDNKNKYSVYVIMPKIKFFISCIQNIILERISHKPLSLKFLNICTDPFFSAGVPSLIFPTSCGVRVRLFKRA